MSSPVVRHPGDDPDLSDEELLARRRAWFEAYTSTRNVHAPLVGGPYTCPCCGHRTLRERGGYDICRECGWEDDGQDDHDSEIIRGGPNYGLSLAEARIQYVLAGGIRQQHVIPVVPVTDDGFEI